MNKITIDEAAKRLMDACPTLYIDLVCWLKTGDTADKSSAYISRNAVILNVFYGDDRYEWYICDTGKSRMQAAIKSARKAFGYDPRMAREKTYFLGGIPRRFKKRDIKISSRRFTLSCVSKIHHENDDSIRLLTENDIELAAPFLSVDDGNFGYVGKNIARDFRQCITEDPNIRFLGIFNGGSLAGMISYEAQPESNYVHLRDIFILPEYRKGGYAGRLTAAALSMHPGLLYICEINGNNAASLATAKAAGFTVADAFIAYMHP